MKVIYDQHGTYVGWLGDNAVYNQSGHLQATIDDGMTFNLEGQYLGQFEAGIFRDKLGCIIGFIEGTKSEATLPVSNIAAPTPPFVSIQTESPPDVPDRRQGAAYPLLRLSNLTWANYLASHEPHSSWDAHPTRYESDLDDEDDMADEALDTVADR